MWRRRAPPRSVHDWMIPANPIATTIDPSCRICGVEGGPISNLCDGSVYHHACYESLRDKATELASTQSAIEAELDELAASGAVNGILLWLSRLLGRPRSVEEPQELRARLTEVKRERLNCAAQIREIHDYWLDYPPDWDDRRTLMLSRYGFCHKCGANLRLQVHHRVPISAGGSHHLSNLECLCLPCHEHAHGNKQIGDGAPHKRAIAFGTRIQILREAIDCGGLVAFEYRNRERRRSYRTIAPQEFIRVGSSLCVAGNCHLRKTRRTFALKRMRAVRHVENPRRSRYQQD